MNLPQALSDRGLAAIRLLLTKELLSLRGDFSPRGKARYATIQAASATLAEEEVARIDSIDPNEPSPLKGAKADPIEAPAGLPI